MRLAIIASHPVQYYAPLYRELAHHLDLTVYYAHRDTAADQARAGFGQGFAWDVDLLSGYQHLFLQNVARQPGLGRFAGVDTPGIQAELRAGRFDAVLVMGWYLKCFLQAVYAAKRAGLPTLVRGDSQLDTPRSRLKRVAKEWLYPPFLRLFDGALVVGQRNRAYWQHYRYPAAQMFASPHCVDTEWFAARATAEARLGLRARLGVPAATPLVLFAGKLVEFKRPLDVVHASAITRRNGLAVEVLVAGSGPLKDAMQREAARLQVPMHMLGFCNQTEMPAAYAAADILVLPSTGRETWGLVANEALACGTRVLLSDAVGCAADLTAFPGAAKAYPVGNMEQLAWLMAATLREPVNPAAIASCTAAHSLQAAASGIVEAVSALTQPGRRSPVEGTR
ncbi:MAG: glycosyltransferase family 4 protein [Rubrivivax sp.]|nr:glycosyltransferase family 4 protein [Rubrivivax sp.]